MLGLPQDIYSCNVLLACFPSRLAVNGLNEHEKIMVTCFLPRFNSMSERSLLFVLGDCGLRLCVAR
jgi:hypothetical protein